MTSRHKWYTPSGILSRIAEKLAKRVDKSSVIKVVVVSVLYGMSELFGATMVAKIAWPMIKQAINAKVSSIVRRKDGRKTEGK